MRGPNDPEPVGYHKFLVDQGGSPLGFIRFTGETCKSCSPANRSRRVGVIMDTPDNRAEVVQCEACDWSMTRPKKDPVGRKMNSGAG